MFHVNLSGCKVLVQGQEQCQNEVTRFKDNFSQLTELEQAAVVAYKEAQSKAATASTPDAPDPPPKATTETALAIVPKIKKEKVDGPTPAVVIKKEILKDTTPKTASCAAVCAADAPAASSAPPVSSSSTSEKSLLPAPSNPVASGEDLTQFYAPESQAAPESKVDLKELFLAADLVVPGIALKKFKQALSAAANAPDYFGVMGLSTVKMYRKERPSVEKLAMADMSQHRDWFWAQAGKHLGGLEAGVLLVPTGSNMHPSEATWPKCCVLNKRHTLTCILQTVWALTITKGVVEGDTIEEKSVPPPFED